MSFTKVYEFQDQNGYESVISRPNSDMKYMGFGRILLKPDQTYEYEMEDREQAVILESGDFTAWIVYDGKIVINGVKGYRKDVYNDLPTALYIPPKAKVCLYSNNGMEARVYTAYCKEGNPPAFCPPENVHEEEPGDYIYKRKYRTIFGQPGKHNDYYTKQLIVGESVSTAGGWIGFPAHRHDYRIEGKECILDEIFSFQAKTTEDGKGGLIQYSFDLDDTNNKLWDEVNIIESNNTAISLPVGYHTTAAMPGSIVYLLWGLAGESKQYKVQFDERYSWLKDCLY